jgi:hypothetical protein
MSRLVGTTRPIASIDYAQVSAFQPSQATERRGAREALEIPTGVLR